MWGGARSPNTTFLLEQHKRLVGGGEQRPWDLPTVKTMMLGEGSDCGEESLEQHRDKWLKGGEGRTSLINFILEVHR